MVKTIGLKFKHYVWTLEARYTTKFERDMKALAKKHVNTASLGEVVDLILENTILSA